MPESELQAYMLNMERIEVCGAPDNAVLFETPEQVYARVYRRLVPDGAAPAVEVRFCQFAGIRSSIRFRDGRLAVRISDLLERAPAPVLEALAVILVAKLVGRPVPRDFQQRYRRFLNHQDVRRADHLARRTRGRKLFAPPKGAHYDLEAVFDDLNRRFFDGKTARLQLGWSRRPSRTTLGQYDAAHNTIVLSSLLDGAHIPRLVVEYVLFHEMLHSQHSVEHTGTRRRIHTKEFREAEKRFPDLDAAKRLLQNL